MEEPNRYSIKERGKGSLCIDYRRLNDVTVKDCGVQPHLRVTLNNLKFLSPMKDNNTFILDVYQQEGTSQLLNEVEVFFACLYDKMSSSRKCTDETKGRTEREDVVGIRNKYIEIEPCIPGLKTSLTKLMYMVEDTDTVDTFYQFEEVEVVPKAIQGIKLLCFS